MFKKLKKKHIIYASLLIGIFSLFIFCTIAYSAINGTVKISGNAYARAEADVRITDFRLASSNNATSSYEEFGKNHIMTDVELVNSSSSISYYVEVSNYGNNSVGIFDITGLPSGVSYTIDDYTLKDKICDDSNTCSGFLNQTYIITLRSSGSYTGSIKLDFDFRPFLNITYEGISGNYRNEFIAGDHVSINVGYLDFVYAYGEEDFDYEYDSPIISFWDAWCDVEIGLVTASDYAYTGDSQTYKVKADGVYKIELWGAQGGNTGGAGAYTSGYIKLNSSDELFFYVGSKGVVSEYNSSNFVYCPFNGGGPASGQAKFTNRYFGTGGGATDVRFVSGYWDDFNSLKSRIMIAAGGGGSYNELSVIRNGGAGGGLVGDPGLHRPSTTSHYGGGGSGGTQVSGGYNEIIHENDYSISEWGWTLGTYGYGTFGIGGRSKLSSSFSGGGAGYYGGGSSTHVQGGGGGSSFISWHDGCDAITEGSTSSNIVHTGQSVHYSGYVFTNTIMIDGSGYKWTDVKGSNVVGMPLPDYSGIMNGNTGNGYARITPISMGDYQLIKYVGASSSDNGFLYPYIDHLHLNLNL